MAKRLNSRVGIPNRRSELRDFIVASNGDFALPKRGIRKRRSKLVGARNQEVVPHGANLLGKVLAGGM
jgi:hypothetical protein